MKSHDLENKLRSQLLEVSKWSVIATDFCLGGFENLLGDMLLMRKKIHRMVCVFVCVCVCFFQRKC